MNELSDLIRSLIEKQLPIGTKEVKIIDFNQDLNEVDIKCKLGTLQNIKLKVSVKITNV